MNEMALCNWAAQCYVRKGEERCGWDGAMPGT